MHLYHKMRREESRVADKSQSGEKRKQVSKERKEEAGKECTNGGKEGR